MTDRFADLAQVARDLGVDAVALVPGPNFTRALGQSFMSHERPFLIVIPAQGAPAAIVPDLELNSWGEVGFEGTVFGWRDQDGYSKAFADLAQALPLTSLAVEGQVMRVFVHHALKTAMPDLRIVDGEAAISGLRTIKTDAELAALQTAIDISERALARVLDGVRVGQTEKQVEGALIQALFAEGAEELSFFPIVAAGDGSALPHGQARADHTLAAGEALLIDFGGRFGGFAADITRTVFVGHASDEARSVYDAVLRANLAGLASAGPGVFAGSVDDAATKVLEASAHADRIVHKTGHGLGREVHEAPYIVRGNAALLRPGMVFTVEPGLYRIGDFGVRIEDDVVITETGCRALTSFSKDLTLVGPPC